jgi:hypothetical protein
MVPPYACRCAGKAIDETAACQTCALLAGVMLSTMRVRVSDGSETATSALSRLEDSNLAKYFLKKSLQTKTAPQSRAV